MDTIIKMTEAHPESAAGLWLLIGFVLASLLLWIYRTYVYHPDGMKQHPLAWLWPYSRYYRRPYSWADDACSPTNYTIAGHAYSREIPPMKYIGGQRIPSEWHYKSIQSPFTYIVMLALFWPVRIAYLPVMWTILSIRFALGLDASYFEERDGELSGKRARRQTTVTPLRTAATLAASERGSCSSGHG